MRLVQPGAGSLRGCFRAKEERMHQVPWSLHQAPVPVSPLLWAWAASSLEIASVLGPEKSLLGEREEGKQRGRKKGVAWD